MATEAAAPSSRPSPWLLWALGVAVMALLAYMMWPNQSATIPAAPSNAAGARSAQAAEPATVDPNDLRVRLDALKAVQPQPGAAERNPFLFQATKPTSGPQPLSEGVPRAATPVPTGPPPPSGPPPIPLKFMGTVEQGPIKLAALTDCKGATFAAREGEDVDGRYRLVRIGVESIVMEYINGTGRTTILVSGECRQ